MSHATPSREAQPCQVCGLVLDVSGEPLFALVKCPRCRSEVRVKTLIGSYELISLLGQGGSSRVFRARVGKDGVNEVALKVLEKENSDYEEHLVHLKNEVTFARLLDHPRVVKVIDFEEDEQGARLSMEIMHGGTLHDLIILGGRISEERLLETGFGILKALSAAYAKGIVHRDLKPANILFTLSGRAKLGDFGLACHLHSRTCAGAHLMATPDYVAPEIISGKHWDFRSDQYGLGGCLYHAITGHPPHKTEGETLQQLRVLKRHQVNLSWKEWKLLPETAALINRMLLPDPENRFVSYDELEAAFLSALERIERSKKGVTAGLESFLSSLRANREKK